MTESLVRVLLVGTGGMVGSVARYGLAGWAQRITASGFPVGTLLVNVAGSLLIGIFLTLSLERGVPGSGSRLLLATGFCGGFTTMSTFSYETLVLVSEGSVAAAAANILGTLFLCMFAVWVGVIIGRLS